MKRIVSAVLLSAVALSCGQLRERGEVSVAIRLVDLFDAKRVDGSTAPATPVQPIVWRFDGGVPSPPPAKFPETRGWGAGSGVAGLTLRDGRLFGRSTDNTPLVHFERTSGLDSGDALHGIEIRMRASDGANLMIQTVATPQLDMANLTSSARGGFWPMETPILAGAEAQTYLLTPLQPRQLSAIRHVIIRPTDAANATFEIESVRLISRKEHLASFPAGVGWQGLQAIFRESLVGHAPETMKFDVTLPARPWFDLAIGTIEDHPVTFRVSARPQGAADEREMVQVDYTVTRPHRWENHPVDLSPLAGRQVTLSLQLLSESPGALGFWGAPVVRSLGSTARTDQITAETSSVNPPRGVIFIHIDTLRRDHLNFYGHSRETAPFLAKLSSEGVLFTNAVAQASWTKVSTSSFMTSLYQSTHGVVGLSDRLPSSVTTMAEVYRSAGYATLSLSSTAFTGQYTNLHQGFEELHESTSLSTQGTPYNAKTAREYVDRIITWVERHREVPFFAYLHVFDPHHPYEPRAPYNTKWSDPARMDQHRKEVTAATKFIEDPFMQGRRLPSRDEVVKAGFDPVQYVTQELDWYDGSIRGTDAEMARLFEQLRRIGLDNETLVVVTSDHGTEFYEHGRFWHGQSVYGELIDIPLIIRWPSRVPGARVIKDLVQSIDIMPTMLGLSGLKPPDGLQGQSLQPFLVPLESGAQPPATWPGWRPRPAISERAPTTRETLPVNNRVSVAIIDGNWKLIHNTTRPPDLPEYELFDVVKDPLNKHNVADQNAEVVLRLSKAISGWRQMASAARVKPDSETTKALSPEELQRLRSLGYVR